ncbi:TrkA family potassium uptake protein [uncultured Ruminococcus sp.]|uniref:potassium channel family protein n=1 Tax=uncultured Ruminococcus sp. TaxID=165186 RepID=UPI00292E7E35|nr:TrkA family potassium uptake protein [uncultured Ruminococcus sp.]
MKSILLIGLGRFGLNIAIQLTQLGHDVLGIDHDEDRVNNALEFVTDAQIGDSTNEAYLRSLGVNNFDVCFVTISNDFQSSLETTYLLKELGAKFVVARAERDGQERFLLRNGADKVIYPEKQVARWAAIRYSSDHLLEYIELDDTHSIYEVAIPEEWLGKTIVQLDVRRKYELTIIGIRDNGVMSFIVKPDTVLTKGMSLLVLGEYKKLKKCFKF